MLHILLDDYAACHHENNTSLNCIRRSKWFHYPYEKTSVSFLYAVKYLDSGDEGIKGGSRGTGSGGALVLVPQSGSTITVFDGLEESLGGLLLFLGCAVQET